MKTCNQCGQIASMDDSYCPRCGSGDLKTENVKDSRRRQRNNQQTRTQVNNSGFNGDNIEEDTMPQQVPSKFRNPNAVKVPNKQAKQPKKPRLKKQRSQNFDGGIEINQDENGVDNFAGFKSTPGGTEVTLKEWIIAYLIMLVPIFNIVYLIMKGFGTKSYVKPSLKTWAVAQLIFMGASIILFILTSGFIANLLISIMLGL